MAIPVRALALLVFAPAVALAADLGRLTALSSVGDPLRAEIEILAVQPSEGASLVARIPPPDVFWRANLEPPPLLDDLRARVERRPKDRYVVILSTTRPVENAFIQILVQLDTATGRVVREYPVLLDEPRGAPTSSGTATAAAASAPERRPPAATGGMHVVKAGDTLHSIARAVRPAGATVEQTVVALYQANEAVFGEGNMNRLPVGSVLALPPDGAVTAIDPAAARQLIRVHGTALPPSAPLARAAAPATGEGRGSTNPVAVVSPPASGDQLHLARAREGTGGALESARGDDIVALQRTLAEVQERIAVLQRELEGIRGTRAVGDDRLGSVDPLDRGLAALPGRSGGEAAAAERPAEGAIANATLGNVAREHGGWLLATFLVGFGCWVVMPVKTARVWLKHRRARERAVLHAALDTPARPFVRTLPRGADNRRMAGRHRARAPALQ